MQKSPGSVQLPGPLSFMPGVAQGQPSVLTAQPGPTTTGSGRPVAASRWPPPTSEVEGPASVGPTVMPVSVGLGRASLLPPPGASLLTVADASGLPVEVLLLQPAARRPPARRSAS